MINFLGGNEQRSLVLCSAGIANHTEQGTSFIKNYVHSGLYQSFLDYFSMDSEDLDEKFFETRVCA